jgi:hypothetical protein
MTARRSPSGTRSMLFIHAPGPPGLSATQLRSRRAEQQANAHAHAHARARTHAHTRERDVGSTPRDRAVHGERRHGERRARAQVHI